MTARDAYHTEKPLVLVVDDVPRNVQVIASYLSKDGYDIAAATNGTEAVNMTKKIEPDLILLDVMMPGMDGFETCRQIKEKPKVRDIPIIFLTAKVETEDVVAGFDAGGVDYITKPFNPRELLARVSTHIRLRLAQKEIVELERKNAAFATAVTANHELNQPLMVLQGNMEMLLISLEKYELDEKHHKYIDKINTSITRMTRILDKFKASTNIQFEMYSEDTAMAIFDEEDEQ